MRGGELKEIEGKGRERRQLAAAGDAAGLCAAWGGREGEISASKSIYGVDPPMMKSRLRSTMLRG